MSLRCTRCKQPYNYRVPRHAFVKKVLFFVPLQRHFCNRCFKKKYVWLPKSRVKKMNIYQDAA
jgi:hypothetical protein